MLKFSDLSLAQKRFVVAVIEADPSIKQDPKITLKRCAEIYYALRDQRTGAKGEKIGYPNWLFKANKVERGLYALPIPNATELSDFAKALTFKANPVAKAKAKVAKLAATKPAKPVKVKAEKPAATEKIETSRLQKIIEDSDSYDDETEDFNQILRENGIEI